MILGVLVLSLLGTLVSRLLYLQLLSGESYRAAAQSNTAREVVNPAVRGLILDQAGRPLVSNRTSMVVTINRVTLEREADGGKRVIDRLAKALEIPAEQISDRLMTCGAEGAKPPPVCWNGSPYQPIPITSDVKPLTALEIMENRTEFPGVIARLDAIRIYPTPFNVNAAHILGYLGPVTEQQLEEQGKSKAFDRLRRTDVVGRSGLEAYYDTVLRGTPAVTTLEVDTGGRVTGTVDERPAVPGSYLVSSIDAKLQSVVEKQLVEAVQRAQEQGYPGDSGAAVVIDVRNGHVLAMASYPTYDPTIWVGGVTKKQFEALMSSDSLSSNAIQGLYAPGSTFKVVSTAAAGKEGLDLYGEYKCPNRVKLGSQVFRNFESAAYGKITLARALEVSCNTVFYGIADEFWLRGGGPDSTKASPDPIAEVARMFGLGSKTGIDLPGESAGRVSSRLFKGANWEAKKDDPKLADYFTALDKENCADGFRWREGDALNAAIGQGDTAVTPLQLAMVYAAIANGGTVYEPQVIKGIMSPDGKVVKEVEPKVKSKVGVPKSTIRFLQDSLPGVTTDGSGETPFEGFPLGQIPVASKTGSAQVTGTKVSTSWFAAYAPADKPRYAIVMMVTQGGTGSKTSGPSVRAIFESIFGVTGEVVNPADSVLIGGAPRKSLPVVRPDGTPVAPQGKDSGMRVVEAGATG
jgi:penicillin-binding protein 2